MLIYLGTVALMSVVSCTVDRKHFKASKGLDINTEIEKWNVNITDELPISQKTEELIDEYDFRNSSLIINHKELGAVVFTNSLDAVRDVLEKQKAASSDLASSYFKHLVSVGLQMAALADNSAAVAFYLDNDGNPYLADSRGRTALHVAAFKGNVEIAKLIASKMTSGVDVKDEYGVTPLFMAVYNNRTQVCKLLLEFGANATIPCLDGRMPLHLTAEMGFLAIAQMLILHNPECINISDAHGETALHIAAANNRTEVVRILLENGADQHVVNSFGRTPLHRVAARGHGQVVHFLLNNSVSNINKQDKHGQTPMNLAASYNNTDIFEDLLKRGGDPSLPSTGGDCPIHHAAINGNVRLLKLLHPFFHTIIDIQDSSGRTPLFLAAFYKRNYALKYLLENNASALIASNGGVSPLHVAVSKGKVQIVELILSYASESVNLIDNNLMTPLCYAARNNNTIIFEALLKGGANTSLADHNGFTPLHFATIMNNMIVVKLIISKNVACIDVQNNLGHTALHIAVDKKRTTIVKYLLDIGAHPYLGDIKKWTPLHFAVNASDLFHAELIISRNKTGIDYMTNKGLTPLFMLVSKKSTFTEFYKLLMKNGADPFIPNKWGTTLLHLVVDTENVEVADLILDCNDCVNVQNIEGETPLNYAVTGSSDLMVKYFLNKGAEPNIPEMYGRTPLYNAAVVGSLPIANILLEHKDVDINIQDNNGTTAIWIAAYKKRVEMVQLFLRRGANPNIHSLNGYTLLNLVAEGGNLELAMLLVNRVDINSQSNIGMTALTITIINNNFQLFNFLLNVGADPNIPDAVGRTSLHYAARICNGVFIEGILDKNKSSLNIPDVQGNTPLMASVRRNCTWNVEYLLQQGANPFIINVDGHMPIHTAALYGNIRLIDILINKSANNIDFPDPSKYTPLMLAAMKGQTKTVMHLLERGADPCLVSKIDTSVLHYVVENENIKIIRQVLKYMSDRCDVEEEVNRQSMLGYNLLAAAVAEGKSEVFFYLIEIGADPLISNHQGKTLLHFAADGGNVKILEYLIANTSIPIESTTRAGETALISAAKHGKKEVFDILLKLGFNNSAVTNYGETILHAAAFGGNVDIMRELLRDSRTNIDVTDVEGNTPLMYAAGQQHNIVANFLIHENANTQAVNIYGENALRWAAISGNLPLIYEFPLDNNRVDSLLGILISNNNVQLTPWKLERLLSISSISNNSLYISAAKGDDDKLKEIFKNQKSFLKKGFPNLLREFTKDYEELIEDVLEEDQTFPSYKSYLSPLDVALLFFGKLSTVKLLITNLNINISKPNINKSLWNPLQLACISTGLYDEETTINKERVFHYFLRNAKPLINHSDRFGWNVIHKAAWVGNARVIYALHKNGAAVDKADNYGRTPLHIAALKGFHMAAKFLLYQSNNSVNYFDIYGFTPMHLTQIYRIKHFFRRLSKTTLTLDPELRYKLLELVDLPSGQQKSVRPRDHLLTMAALISAGADINIQDRTFHWTPLHWAAASGDFNATVFLVTNGAKINIPSKRDQTPMYLARFWGRKDIYHYLKVNNGVW